MKLVQLIKNIAYLGIIILWFLMFVFNRALASDLLPLVIVLSFVNIDTRIGEIIKQVKELGK